MDRPDSETSIAPARLIIVMGVSGSGKSTVGAALAAALDAPFLDADDYHPPENIAKMSQGIALNDADRAPWLSEVGRALRQAAGETGVAVAACSALRRSYRDQLVAAAGGPILFVLLDGTQDAIARRMAARPDHFMPEALLDSQFATLERPMPDETALRVDTSLSVSEQVRLILSLRADRLAGTG